VKRERKQQREKDRKSNREREKNKRRGRDKNPPVKKSSKREKLRERSERIFE
jgi:hypothetical protein